MEKKLLVKSGVKKCSGCGGNLEFSPRFQCLYCKNCEKREKIEKDSNYLKHFYSDTENHTKTQKISGNVSCSNCGARLKLKNNNVSGVCPYCGTPLTVAMESSDITKPDFIIPFAIDKQQAQELFVKNVKKKAFLPNKIKKAPEIEKINSFYFPCYSFDENTASDYKGRLIHENSVTDSDGNTHTSISYQNISGHFEYSYKDVLVETSAVLEQSDLYKILPYNTRETYKFNNDFLLGYSLEYANESLNELKKRADYIIDSQIKSDILRKYSYDRVDYLTINTVKSEEKYSFGVLPAYQVSIDYKGKKYNTLLNGQTGKLGGGLPKSKLKISMFVLSIIIPILIFIGLILFVK